MKQVTIKIRDDMEAETAEWLLNVESYLSIKAKYPYQKICSNYKRLCFKCQQPQCDYAGFHFPIVSQEEKKVTK